MTADGKTTDRHGSPARRRVCYPSLTYTLPGGQVWDLRAMRRSAEVESAHHMPVRDVDFARGQAHLLLSAGDDCRLRLWDLRCGCGVSLHQCWGLGYSTLQSELVWQAHWVLVYSRVLCTWICRGHLLWV